MSFVLGLTGSIGMGKSTTAKMFAELGVPVWDADAAVHRLYATGGAAVEPLRALNRTVVAHGAVSRDALKQWIGQDDTALRQIEQIVHPLVARDRADFITRNSAAPIIVLDIPLLFETGAEGQMNAIAVVSVPADVQRARVMDRGTMTKAQFESILAKQLPDAEKRARADFVIETLTMDGARQSVQAIIAKIGERLTDA